MASPMLTMQATGVATMMPFDAPLGLGLAYNGMTMTVLLVSLATAIATEIGILRAFGYAAWGRESHVALANCLTNPCVNALNLLVVRWSPLGVVLMQAATIFIEAIVLWLMARSDPEVADARPLRALWVPVGVANLVSGVIGFVMMMGTVAIIQLMVSAHV